MTNKMTTKTAERNIDIASSEHDETVSNCDKKELNNCRLYSLAEMAIIFGVTRQTIYAWTRKGTIPHIKIGKKVYYTKQQIDAIF